MNPYQDIAVRLADEGVPLAAIARAICVPADTVRAELTEARDDGRLVALPPPDWSPPGAPRDRHALRFSRLMPDRDALALAVKEVFGMTPAEVELFLTLLQAPVIRREGVASNLTSVHISHIRKRLQPHGIEITTLWGCGYKLSEADRHKAMNMLLMAAS